MFVSLSYDYTQYTATGLLKSLVDQQILGAGGATDNSANYVYDGLGRLKQASGGKLGTRDYDPNALGNLAKKDGKDILYDPSKPHQMTLYDSSGSSVVVDHDVNGNREDEGARQYLYDKDDRVVQITDGSDVLDFSYEYTGRRVARIENDTEVRRYYSDLFEATDDGWVTKRYFAGNRIVAQRREWKGAQFAANGESPVRFASAPLDRPAIVLLVRNEFRLGVAAGLVLLSTGLVLSPWRRKRVAGVRVRHGQVVLVTLAFSASMFPWPLMLKPESAWAQCPSGPTPTPTPGPETVHFHLDHLGSVQAITSSTGAVDRYIRYLLYGEIRGRFGPTGNPVGRDERYRYEFTGYETDLTTGLFYAGARFYDPVKGHFLTHDPARQFASPYAYGPWDPINGTDPTGAVFGIDDAVVAAFIIGSIVGFSVGVAQTAANGGNAEQIITAGFLGAMWGGVAGAGLGALNLVIAPALAPLLHAIELAAGTYSTVEGFRQGQYIAGAVGVVGVAFGAYGLYEDLRFAQGANGTAGVSQQDQLAFNARAFDQRYSAPYNWSGGVGGLLRTTGRFGLDVAGKIWALPNTIVGGLVGVAGVPFGAEIQFGNNAIQFVNFPLGEAGTGLTLGNVQIFPAGTDPATYSGFFYNSPVPINIGLHEEAHTFQYQVLGPTFLPAYFLSGGISASNPFELAANRYALGGSFFP